MKTTINGVSKKISLLALFMTTLFFANGQSKESPAWLVSKDVQRYANKSLFEDQNLRRSHIQAKSTAANWTISKGVHSSKSVQTVKGNVKSEGIPAWTISKGVQQIGRK